MRVKSLQLCLTLCFPLDCGLPGSSVCGILQAGVLEWVAIPFSRGPSRLRDRTCMFYVSLQCQAGSLLLVPPGKPKKHSQKIVVVELISCVQVFCDPMDCSPPGSSVHGIPQARNTGEGCHFLLQRIFPAQGSNLHLLHCRQILCH